MHFPAPAGCRLHCCSLQQLLLLQRASIGAAGPWLRARPRHSGGGSGACRHCRELLRCAPPSLRPRRDEGAS